MWDAVLLYRVGVLCKVPDIMMKYEVLNIWVKYGVVDKTV